MLSREYHVKQYIYRPWSQVRTYGYELRLVMDKIIGQIQKYHASQLHCATETMLPDTCIVC